MNGREHKCHERPDRKGIGAHIQNSRPSIAHLHEAETVSSLVTAPPLLARGPPSTLTYVVLAHTTRLPISLTITDRLTCSAVSGLRMTSRTQGHGTEPGVKEGPSAGMSWVMLG